MSLPGETPETADAVVAWLCSPVGGFSGGLWWMRTLKAHIFNEIDKNGDDKICWPEFYQWLLRWNVMRDESEDAARSLFTFLDRDGNGTIDTQEMMDALMLLSEFESKSDKSLSATWLARIWWCFFELCNAIGFPKIPPIISNRVMRCKDTMASNVRIFHQGHISRSWSHHSRLGSWWCWRNRLSHLPWSTSCSSTRSCTSRKPRVLKVAENKHLCKEDWMVSWNDTFFWFDMDSVWLCYIARLTSKIAKHVNIKHFWKLPNLQTMNFDFTCS